MIFLQKCTNTTPDRMKRIYEICDAVHFWCKERTYKTYNDFLTTK